MWLLQQYNYYSNQPQEFIVVVIVLCAYYTDRNNVTVRKSSFDNNRAGYDGGVMYVSFSSSITVGNIASLATMKLVMMVE